MALLSQCNSSHVRQFSSCSLLEPFTVDQSVSVRVWPSQPEPATKTEHLNNQAFVDPTYGATLLWLLCAHQGRRDDSGVHLQPSVCYPSRHVIYKYDVYMQL